MVEEGVSSMELFKKKFFALFFSVSSEVHWHGTDDCFGATAWKQLLMQVQRGNLGGKSSLRRGTDPLRVFSYLHQATLWIFIYRWYFLTMKHKNVGNCWGNRSDPVLLQRSWNCTEILLYGWCWSITCNIPGFIFHFCPVPCCLSFLYVTRSYFEIQPPFHWFIYAEMQMWLQN